MRKLIYLFFLLAGVACKQEKIAVLEGAIDFGDYSKVQLFLQGERLDTIKIDEETRCFSYELRCDSSQIVKLLGIVGEGQNCFSIDQALYVKPGKRVHLKVHLKNRNAFLTVDEKDEENRVLVAYQQFYAKRIRAIWENLSEIEDFQDSLFQLYVESLNTFSSCPTPMIRTYLGIEAYLAYFRSYEGMSYQLARQHKFVKSSPVKLPPIHEVLDDPMALEFYDARRCIYSRLQEETKEPEEQIQLLQEWFQTVDIQEEMRKYICRMFLDRIPYSEANFNRLKNLSVTLPEQETMLKNYQDKRFAAMGAPLPDAVFEDQTGKQHRLSELVGKYIYIDLWASWCGPCCAEVPHLKKLEKELNNPHVVFVSISLDTNREAWLKKMEQLEMHGNQWIVTDQVFAEMLNVKGIPHFLLYSKEGTLMQYKAPRPSSGERLKKMLSDLK